MSPENQKITREQLQEKFREVTGGVQDEVSGVRSQAMTVGLAVAVAVVAVTFLIGRRSHGDDLV